MSEDILLSRQDGIATVTFNRPAQRNAVSYHGWLELRRIAVELERDSDVKVVVFTGAGEAAFSAGADIKDFEAYRNNSTMAKVYSEAFDGAMDAIEGISKPTISLIRASASAADASYRRLPTSVSLPTTAGSASPWRGLAYSSATRRCAAWYG